MKPLNQPALRFAGFADAWEQRKLGDVVDIVGGGTPETTNSAYWNGDIDWYSPTEIGAKVYANGSVKKITTLGLEKSSAKILPANKTILFTSRAGIGDMAILQKQGATNQGFQSFIVRDGINIYFLYSMGKRIKDFALKNASGSTFLEVSKNQLVKMDVFMPSEKEQIAIGNFFRQLDEAIAAHQRKLEKIKELKNSLLHKMFPKDGETVPELRFSGFTDAWEQGRLGAITEIFDNLRIPVTENLRAHGHTPYYGANGIQGFIDGFTHDGEFILIAEDGANNLKNYPIQYTVGKIWVNNHAHVLKGVDEVLNSLFLAYCMKSMDISKYLVGGTRAKLTSSAMKSITIIFPSLQEQTAIGNFFRQLDTVIEAYQQKSNQLHTLKTALLGKMFV